MGHILRGIIELGLAAGMFMCLFAVFRLGWSRMDSWLARLAALAVFLVLGLALGFLRQFD